MSTMEGMEKDVSKVKEMAWKLEQEIDELEHICVAIEQTNDIDRGAKLAGNKIKSEHNVTVLTSKLLRAIRNNL